MALRNHMEAERRRRESINANLSRVRSFISGTTKEQSKTSFWSILADSGFIFFGGKATRALFGSMEMVEEGAYDPEIFRKHMKIVEKGREDRISELPDCLIIEILSRLLSTKDAIKTCTLSKRWKHLWTWVHTLSFISILYDHCSLKNPNTRSDFFSMVDKTLTQCRQLKLKKFEVCSSYEIRFESQVNNWIRYAISRDIEELNLSFLNMGSKVEVLLDQILFSCSCLTDLRLEGCKLNPSGAISWKNLRSLCISYGNLNEDLIENILSGSPVLETLALEMCYGYRRLNITSKSVKKLVISGYMDPDNFVGVEINASNILSLTIRNHLMLQKLLLVNVSSVVEANLDFTNMVHWGTMLLKEEEEMLKGFILNLRHVKELKIGCFSSKVVSRLEANGFVFPSNAKYYYMESKVVEDLSGKKQIVDDFSSCLGIFVSVFVFVRFYLART